MQWFPVGFCRYRPLRPDGRDAPKRRGCAAIVVSSAHGPGITGVLPDAAACLTLSASHGFDDLRQGAVSSGQWSDDAADPRVMRRLRTVLDSAGTEPQPTRLPQRRRSAQAARNTARQGPRRGVIRYCLCRCPNGCHLHRTTGACTSRGYPPAPRTDRPVCSGATPSVPHSVGLVGVTLRRGMVDTHGAVIAAPDTLCVRA